MATQIHPGLTRGQRRVLDAYHAHLEANGAAPTLEELATALEVSRVTVHGHMRLMAERGYFFPPANNQSQYLPRGPRPGQDLGEYALQEVRILVQERLHLESRVEALEARVRELEEHLPAAGGTA